MSRRIGQAGCVEKRNDAYRGRYLIDIPGEEARRKKSVVLGFCRDMTRSEARRKLKEVIASEGLNAATYHIPSALCFEKHVKLWEQAYLSRRKPSTQSTMRYHLNTYLIPRWGKTAIDYISAERVNDWLPELGRLSPYTVRGIVATLQTVLGVRYGRGKIHYPSMVAAQDEVRCYSVEEVTAMLDNASGQDRCLFTLAAETGMRAGELYGLQVEDLDFVRNVIHVRRSSWNGILQSTKTPNSRRVIPVQEYVMSMLREHTTGRAGLIFLTRRHTGLKNTTVLHKHLHPLQARLGIPIGGMHAFRHFRVSFLIQNETPMELIRLWIGHGSDFMVRRYMHLSGAYQRATIGRIPPVMDPWPQISTGASVC